MYEVRGVSKWFTKGPAIVRAVDGVSLEIDPGEFIALEGPSG
jgi:ABC-type oligopeptide transport system ATPase subunit